MKNLHKQIIIIAGIFLLTFLPRLYKIDNPVADWHSWRQSDTAAVARSLATEEFNPFFPRADNYLPMNGLPNPERYFLNEFPLYNSVVAIIYKLLGVNVMYARLVSVMMASVGAVFLYLLVKDLTTQKLGLTTAIVYALLPYNIYYGRVIMPDPTFIALGTAALYFVNKWTETDKNYWAIIAGITLALSMLAKPYSIILGLPIAFLLLKKFRWKTFTNKYVYLFGAIALIPLILWRYHITQYPEGMFGSGWLINQGNIRFTGAFFRWLVFERMNRLIFATGGFVLLFIGFIAPKINKESWFFVSWFLAVLVYVTYFARGNVTHDYYQLPIVPVGSFFVAKGILFLFKFGTGSLERLINMAIATILFLLMLAFGWYETRGFFNINHPEIVEAGHVVDMILPKDARVIAPYQKDPAFLYQTNRNGWTDFEGIVEGDIESWIAEDGATHLVSVNFDDRTNYWMKRCTIVHQNDRFVIVDLTKCKDGNEETDLYPKELPVEDGEEEITEPEEVIEGHM